MAAFNFYETDFRKNYSTYFLPEFHLEFLIMFNYLYSFNYFLITQFELFLIYIQKTNNILDIKSFLF